MTLEAAWSDSTDRSIALATAAVKLHGRQEALCTVRHGHHASLIQQIGSGILLVESRRDTLIFLHNIIKCSVLHALL